MFEVRQRISEPPLTTCEVCGGDVRRLLSAAPFILKGDGWYVTDYPSESRKKAVESEKNSTKAPAAPNKVGSTETTAPKGADGAAGAKEGAKAGDGAKSSAPAAAPSTKSD